MYNFYISVVLYDFDIDNDDDNIEIDQENRDCFFILNCIY